MDVITTHINADFDCLGAMVAARKLYPEALMVFSGSQEKSMRDFFLKSTSYALNFARMKEIDLSRVTRLILVDCQHSSRIGRFAEILGRPGLEVHIYDHHPESSGDITPAGGVIRECGSSTTILTLILRDRGIDVTPVEISLLNDLLKSLKTTTLNGVDVSIACTSVDHYIGDIAVLAHMMRDMENLQALFLVVGMGSRVYVVARSRIPEVNVGDILRELGGGGHATAASATVRELTIIQVLERLDDILRVRVNPKRVAADIMTSPVHTLPAETTIAEARELLTRYNVNAMPVTDNGVMKGIISRRIVEQALYHNLGEVPVTDYMHTEFMSAATTTPLTEIRDYFVGQNRRFVPIFDGGEMVGVITRTDLLRYMYRGEALYDLARDAIPVRRKEAERLISKQLAPRISRVLKDLGGIGEELSLPVYVVGGFVRDLLLGTENSDIDVTVEGDGILFAETFAARFGCRCKSHQKFGTAVIVFPDGFKVDVASTRLEYYASPGALPTVERSSLKADLYRRDFTINTLAIRLNTSEFGLLIDYYGGQRDIQGRVIRVLHNLSFVEDPTRVFRAIRFEQRLGFRIARHTENLIRNAVKMNFLEKLGGKRLLTELVHILREKEPFHAVERMADLGLLRFIHGDLHLTAPVRRLLGGAEQTVSWFDLLFLDRNYEKWAVYFLALCDQLGGEEFRETCARLAISEHYRQKLCEMRERGLAALLVMRRRGARKSLVQRSEIYFWLKDLPVEVLLYLMAKAGNDEVKKYISLYVTRLQGVTIGIGGDDLMALGVPRGPDIRRILDGVLTARLNSQVRSREEELALAAELAKGAGCPSLHRETP